jgi:hypothetical protein
VGFAFTQDNKPAILKGEEKFVDAMTMQGRVAIMSSTITLLDGKPTPWGDIPDEGTEIAEIHIDMKRKVVTKITYVTRKDL